MRLLTAFLMAVRHDCIVFRIRSPERLMDAGTIHDLSRLATSAAATVYATGRGHACG